MSHTDTNKCSDYIRKVAWVGKGMSLSKKRNSFKLQTKNAKPPKNARKSLLSLLFMFARGLRVSFTLLSSPSSRVLFVLCAKVCSSAVVGIGSVSFDVSVCCG